jgi:DNA modification methylase
MLKRRDANRSLSPGARTSLLSDINWSFSTPFSVGRSGVSLFDARKHHWYPATFIPELPYTLIELLTSPGAVVYDPFGGIGTAMFQALLLGRAPYANELCRVAVEVVRDLWTLLSPNVSIKGAVEQIERIVQGYDPTVRYESRAKRTAVRVDELRPWYHPSTFNKLMYLASREAQCADAGTRAALRVSLSAILKAVCAQDRGWGCIADNVLPKAKQLEKDRDALLHMRRHATILLRDVERFRSLLPECSVTLLNGADVNRHVLHGDVITGQPVIDDSVDLVVTSPPYPSMTDYATSQRLSYYWLGADPSDDLPKEIGARRRRFARDAIDRYRSAMKSVIEVICRKIRVNGYVCFVLPSFKPDQKNNMVRRRAIQECLGYVSESGLLLEHDLERILPERRRHHNQGWTSLERERIHIFRRAE